MQHICRGGKREKKKKKKEEEDEDGVRGRATSATRAALRPVVSVHSALCLFARTSLSYYLCSSLRRLLDAANGRTTEVTYCIRGSYATRRIGVLDLISRAVCGRGREGLEHEKISPATFQASIRAFVGVRAGDARSR